MTVASPAMPVLLLLIQAADSLASLSGGLPSAASSPFESLMLSHDKIYVVLGVVLIIWMGILYLLFRNDRRLAALERRMEERISKE
jgi:hypothetical protein